MECLDVAALYLSVGGAQPKSVVTMCLIAGTPRLTGPTVPHALIKQRRNAHALKAVETPVLTQDFLVALWLPLVSDVLLQVTS